MGLLKNVFGIGKSASEIETETFPAVIGSDKQQFSFVYTHKHWLAGHAVEHHITGDIAVGVQSETSKIQKWSILMNNIQCEWTLDCLPEMYLFFNCIKRIELYVDEHGKLLDTLYPISQLAFLKEKKKEIAKHIKDQKQANSLNRFFESNLSNSQFLQQIVPHNPVIKLLINARLVANLENSKPGLNQIAEAYHIPRYFGNDAILPIKACWKYKPDKNENRHLTWLRVGGLDGPLFKKQDLSAWLNTINDNFNIGEKLNIDFSEQYQFNAETKLNVSHLNYADSYLETIIAEGWYKEEAVMIRAHDKEVAYG